MIPAEQPWFGPRITKPTAAAGRVFCRYWDQYRATRRPPLDEPRIVGFGIDTGSRFLTVTWMMPSREVRFTNIIPGSNIIEHPSGNGFLVAHHSHPVCWVKWDGSRREATP